MTSTKLMLTCELLSTKFNLLMCLVFFSADLHFKYDVIAFIGPACAFALEGVARLAAYWNTPIITGELQVNKLKY